MARSLNAFTACQECIDGLWLNGYFTGLINIMKNKSLIYEKNKNFTLPFYG